MPIKTTGTGANRRIITKLVAGQRRVSCSCCEETGCCMYPANGYNIFFFENDLPDELIFNLYVDTNLLGTYTAIKNATANGIYWWDLGGGDSRALRHEGEQWVLYAAEFPNEQPPSSSLGGQRCLIDDPEFNIFPVFEDNFEDTYTITTPFSSGTVIRQNLCLWNGIDGNGCPLQLLYGGFGGDPETEPAESALKWSVEFQKFESPVEGQPEICTVNYGRLKSGFQNSPTGTYDIPYTTEGPESATVS